MEFILPADQQMCNACMSGHDTTARPPHPQIQCWLGQYLFHPGGHPSICDFNIAAGGLGGDMPQNRPDQANAKLKNPGNIYSIHSTDRAGCLWLKGRVYSQHGVEQANANLEN